MKTIEKSISQLLYDHDCVIIPGLGGFISSYMPSEIHPVVNSFSPPSKNISFNSKLNKNDGLLANHLADKQNISYSEALQQIDAYVKLFNKNLESNKKFIISNVGSFYHNPEGSPEFTPTNNTNYLNDAFGLSKFVSLPVKRTYPGSNSAFADRKTESIKEHQTKETRNSHRRKANIPLIAASFLILFFAAWSIIKTADIRNLYTSYSSIIDIPKNTDKQNAANINNKEAIQSSAVASADKPAIEKVTEAKESSKTSGDIKPKPEASLSVPKNNASHINPEASTIQRRYHIITGAFANKDNASDMVESLRKEGYDAAIINPQTKSLYRVSCASYVSKADAIEKLKAIRTEKNANAWLLKK